MLVFDSPPNKHPKKRLNFMLAQAHNRKRCCWFGTPRTGHAPRSDRAYHPFIVVIMDDIQLASLLANCNEKGFKEKQVYGTGYASEI